MGVYYVFPEHRKAGSVDIYLHSTNLQAQPIVLGRGTLGKSLSTFLSLSYHMNAYFLILLYQHLQRMFP